MKPALQVLAGVALLVLLAAFAVRPGSDLALFWRLNGQPTRWVMADGGASGLFGSGQQCMTVQPNDVIKLTPSAAMYLCVPSPLGKTMTTGDSPGTWDGGCSSTATDVQAGDYVGANVEHYVVTGDATNLCQVPVTGSVNSPVFRMQ